MKRHTNWSKPFKYLSPRKYHLKLILDWLLANFKDKGFSFILKSVRMLCSLYITFLLQHRDLRINKVYLSLVCLHKSNNVYEVHMVEEILKKDLFFKLNYVETSCVWSDLYLLHVNAPWPTFTGFRFEEQVCVCRYVCVAEGLRREGEGGSGPI